MNAFLKAFELFEEKYNLSLDYFIGSWRFKYGSDEWAMAKLKSRMNRKEALEYLKRANEELKKI